MRKNALPLLPYNKKLEPCHSSVRGCRYGTVYEQESDYKSLKSQLQDTIQEHNKTILQQEKNI